MKKTLALILALLMVLPMLVVPTAAEETTENETENELKFVPMSDCDSTNGWFVSNQVINDIKLTLDTEEYSQGTGSISFSFTGLQTAVGALQWQWQNAEAPIDITGMNYLRFDLYVDNAVGIANANFDIEIRDVDHMGTKDYNGDGKLDEVEATASIPLSSLVQGELKDGWNTVEIPFASLNYWGNVDKTQIAYFRMFQSNPGKAIMKGEDGQPNGDIQYSAPSRIIGTEGVTTTIKIDNAYFTSESTVSAPEHYFALNKGQTFKQYAGGNWETLKGKITEMDASDYDTIAFDLYLEDLSLQNTRLTIELSSGGECDVEESYVELELDNLAAAIGQTLTVGWNRLEVPFSVLANSNAYAMNNDKTKVLYGSCDYKHLDYFRLWFSVGSFTIDDDKDGVTGNNINTEAGETEPEREYGHYMVVAHARLLTKNTDTAVLFWTGEKAPVGGSANVGDIDGDGVKEFVWCNEVGTVTHPSNSGAKEIKLGKTATGYPNMVGIEFEIYVTDITAAKSGTMYWEFSHANACDGPGEVGPAGGNFNTMFGVNVIPNTWQTVRIYPNLKTRDTSILGTYATSSAPNTKSGEFNPAGFNYMRIYGGNYTATDLKIGMRNFKILRDFNYEQPTEENCTAPLTMGTDSPMSMASRMRLPTEQDPLNYAWPIVYKKYGETFGFATQSQLSFGEGKELDLTGMDTMHFDLYLENYDPAIRYEFELRSAGGDDGIERRFTQATWAQIVGHNNLKDGWNHVEIPLEAFSAAKGTDMSAINYIRIFSQNSEAQTVTVEKTTIVAIDNLCFSGTLSDSVDTMNFNTYRWDANVSSTVINIPTEDDVANMAWRIVTSDGTTTTGSGARSARKTFIYKASETALLSMDIYLSDYANAKGNTYQFELTSSGGMDKEEMQRSGTMEDMFGGYVINADGSKGTLGEGWNHIEIPLAIFRNATDCNKSNISWVGIYPNAAPVTTGNPYVVAFDNVQFIEPAPETKLVSAQPTLNESIDFTIKLQDDLNRPVALECIFAGEAGTSKTVKATDYANGFYTSMFTDIPAHRMSDLLTMKMWTLDGDKLLLADTVENYSVRNYIVNKLTDATDAKLTTLLSDLLYYGAAAQTYASYNTDDLATSIDEALLAKLTPSTFTAPEKLNNVVVGAAAENGPKFRSVTLVLDGTVHIRYTFSAASVDGLTLTVGGKTYTSFVENGECYYVDVPVSANQFGTVYTAHFGEDTAYSVNYSVNHYIATKHPAAGAKLGALLEALYNYGASAAAYQ